jgi:hypothetical protein
VQVGMRRALHLVYLAGCGILEAGRQTGRAPSTVSAQLAQADGLLATFFQERKRVKEAKAQALRDALQAARPAKLQIPVPTPAPVKRARLNLKEKHRA